MAGLPKKYAKLGFKKGWREYKKTNAYKRKTGKTTTRRSSRSRKGGKMTRSRSPRKKITVGSALDMGSFAAPALYEGVRVATGAQSGRDAAVRSVGHYTGFFPDTGDFQAERLVGGYGAVANRLIEKKAFKAMGIRGPRTCIRTIGDVLDHATYWGATAVEVWDHRSDPELAARHATRIQYGMDYGLVGTRKYQPADMVLKKILPYAGQKLIRKFMRSAGIKMPSFNLGG